MAISALRFLYKVTLKKDWTFADIIPAPKKPQTLPVVLSPEEVVQFLACVANRKHCEILTTCYGADLRVSEAIALTPPAIDSKRMDIAGRARQGNEGSLRDALPTAVRDPASVVASGKGLSTGFPGDIPSQHISRAGGARVPESPRYLQDFPSLSPRTPTGIIAIFLLGGNVDPLDPAAVRRAWDRCSHRNLYGARRESSPIGPGLWELPS